MHIATRDISHVPVNVFMFRIPDRVLAISNHWGAHEALFTEGEAVSSGLIVEI